MDCPVCQNTKLVMSERQGIEIDYCPSCRGVWLDRGELDKIIERTSVGVTQPATQRPDQYAGQPHQPDGFGRSHQPQGYHQHQQDHYKKKKKEGFLSDLFDF
ncbi:TFIIB-type zinc ribbon-containing protein [Noviherbaspirillum sp. Root189]|uniref:TFIIB-type zinc ribbon-containing protein n=1 Tax=Noviherbaspirillum sp. Root189 TaxID=1736487 RepID=UPI00070C08C8|nr:zf-TFIIB domain-containing protein [Noviherbaspirillum sp. Root189]